MEAGDARVELRPDVPPELEGGIYANFLIVWHSPYEFTLDFCATLQPEQGEAGEVVIPCRAVSRIRLPVTLIFEVLRALNESMTSYEEIFVEIRHPGDER